MAAMPRRFPMLAPLPLLAGGCSAVVLHPAGDVALQQRNLILISTGLMLLIILPVMALTVLFAWRYRATNAEATYAPDWDHSTSLELVIWSAPLLIIICLGALTWGSTHLLDPYRPLSRLGPTRAVPVGATPLEVQVVALDWKWLFIYPQLGLATVNELAAPAGMPIRFRITASTVMNSFFVPTLAGQIYAMPGMETTLNAVLDRPGEFSGFSANYSGAGFSGMHFAFHGMDRAGFQRWVAAARAGKGTLDAATYLRLAKPSEDVPAMRFASVTPGLYGRIVNMCVAPGTPCMAQTMAGDMARTMGPRVNDSAAPLNGTRPTGALLKAPRDKGESPNMSSPRAATPAGSTMPGAQKNRNLSLAAPAAAPARG